MLPLTLTKVYTGCHTPSYNELQLKRARQENAARTNDLKAADARASHMSVQLDVAIADATTARAALEHEMSVARVCSPMQS